MNLQDFMFPITERPVAINNGHSDFTDWENFSTFLTSDYKAIVREDTNEPISIVKKSYQVVPNETLINKLMHELLQIDTPFRIDDSHSFVTNEWMRLQLTFPDLALKDDESAIALSLFLHNSYDMSEGVRMFWGAIRYVYSNGSVFCKVLSQFYARPNTVCILTMVKIIWVLKPRRKIFPEIRSKPAFLPNSSFVHFGKKENCFPGAVPSTQTLLSKIR